MSTGVDVLEAPAPLKPLSTKAVASVVLFGAGLVVPLVFNVVGIVYGVLGVRETGARGAKRGRGVAILSTVLNALALCFYAVMIYLVVYVGMIKGEL